MSKGLVARKGKAQRARGSGRVANPIPLHSGAMETLLHKALLVTVALRRPTATKTSREATVVCFQRQPEAQSSKTEVPRGSWTFPNMQRRARNQSEIGQTQPPLTSDESWLLWKIQDSFQSTGIKAELLVVSCISDSESPLLQPTATGRRSKTGSRSHLPVRCRLLLPSSVPEPLNLCPGCKPAQRNSQKPGASTTAEAAGQVPPPTAGERVISHRCHADRDNTREGESPGALS